MENKHQIGSVTWHRSEDTKVDEEQYHAIVCDRVYRIKTGLGGSPADHVKNGKNAWRWNRASTYTEWLIDKTSMWVISKINTLDGVKVEVIADAKNRMAEEEPRSQISESPPDNEVINALRAKSKAAFKKELDHIINKHSMEYESNTPDWMLTDYLMQCLETFNSITTQRENWYGRGKVETNYNFE